MKAKHREKQKIMLFWGVTAIMVLLLFAETLKDSNVETFGKVHIALTEPGCEERITENFARTVAPGETIEKNPTITLSSGSKPAYLRAKIHFKGLSSSQCGELARGLKLADGWSHEVRDGYFYYQTKVEPGTAVPFFSGIVVPRRWKEERTGMAFELCVSAQAMEADYLESGQKLLFTEEPEEEWLFQPGSLQAMSD